jgi:hypothetical protein
MAAKRSISRQSGRTLKRPARRTRPTKESKSVQVGAEQRFEAQQTKSGVSPLDAAPSLDERVEAERQRLFKALSIVECCRLSTASLYEVRDSEYMIPAFEVITDLLTTCAEELERVASECENLA